MRDGGPKGHGIPHHGREPTSASLLTIAPPRPATERAKSHSILPPPEPAGVSQLRQCDKAAAR